MINPLHYINGLAKENCLCPCAHPSPVIEYGFVSSAQASRKFIVDDSVIVKAEIAVQDDCSSEPTVSFIHKFTGVSHVRQMLVLFGCFSRTLPSPALGFDALVFCGCVCMHKCPSMATYCVVVYPRLCPLVIVFVPTPATHISQPTRNRSLQTQTISLSLSLFDSCCLLV